MNYTNITFEDLYTSFITRLAADPRFKNIGSATLIGMFLETLAANTDMTLYNLQRLLEEQFQDTARLDSSHIKIAYTRGYQIRRPVPAQSELCITLKGPFPKEFKELNPFDDKISINFTNEIIKLKLFNEPYRLAHNYVYTLSPTDIKLCTQPTWRKTFKSAKFISKKLSKYQLQCQNPEDAGFMPIKVYQGEQKTIIFKGEDYINNFTENNPQEYEIPDISFSNWYGRRDPFNNTNTPSTSIIIKPSKNIPGVSPRKIDIEDNAILLNPELLDNIDTKYNSNHKICLINTDENKTPIISFSPLKNLIEKGLSYVQDSNGNYIPEDLIVTYLSTNGAISNRTNTAGMKLTHDKNIFISINGKIVDITDNIEISLRTDIAGGLDFESNYEIDDNSEAAYFSSMMKLVSARDLLKYLVMLDKPINVTNALVYGVDGSSINNIIYAGKTDIDKEKANIDGINQNYIMYTITSDMYTKIKNKWYPKFLLCNKSNSSLSDDVTDGFIYEEDSPNMTTLFGTEFEDHITDYIKFIMSPQGFYNTYYTNTTNSAISQSIQNIISINNKILRLIPSNNILYSLPPFLHYYDLVGTVKVNSTAKDLDNFKEQLQNKIYEYLNKTSNSDREIYKSNLIKLCLDTENVKSADLDLKVSSIISPDFTIFTWDKDYLKEIFTNTGYYSLLCETDKISSDYNLYITDILIPYNDSHTQVFNLLSEEQELNIKLSFNTSNNDKINYQYVRKISSHKMTQLKNIKLLKLTLDTPIAENLTNVKIEDYVINNDLNDYYVYNYDLNNISIIGNEKQNYWTSSKFSDTNIDLDYNIDNTTVKKINNTINEWLENITVHDQADRIIDLPYEVKSYETITRLEEIRRLGDIISDDEHTLSEYTFWNYLAPKIIRIAYPYDITETTKIDNSIWVSASKLLIDIYKILKPGLSDSILDDNNNITNFSTEQDFAIIRCKFNIEYANNY